MSARDSRQIPRRLAALEVVGGATYDALIALTAAAHGATLVTLDRRAISVYQRCGAAFDLLAE